MWGDLGVKLKESRKFKGLTCHQVAQVISLSEGSLLNYERSVSPIPLLVYIKLSKLYKTDILGFGIQRVLVDTETLGGNIKYYRKLLNLTQNELAKKLGVTPKTLSRYERGLSYPSIDLFIELCTIFNISETPFLLLENRKLKGVLKKGLGDENKTSENN